MNCQGNVNSTLHTQLPHKFSYIVATLGHNHFESPNNILERKHLQLNGKSDPTRKTAMSNYLGPVHIFQVEERDPHVKLFFR
jgi:hypothetical protein